MNDITTKTLIHAGTLKPCPFCGKQIALITDIETRYFIFTHANLKSCPFYEFKIPWEYATSITEAIELWNRRI